VRQRQYYRQHGPVQDAGKKAVLTQATVPKATKARSCQHGNPDVQRSASVVHLERLLALPDLTDPETVEEVSQTWTLPSPS